ncbi:MAG: hypothetical protein M1482_04480 [Chloroflexi bacterium]|nr:hypothetical protein [Chloroflexota bacterium]
MHYDGVEFFATSAEDHFLKSRPIVSRAGECLILEESHNHTFQSVLLLGDPQTNAVLLGVETIVAPLIL